MGAESSEILILKEIQKYESELNNIEITVSGLSSKFDSAEKEFKKIEEDLSSLTEEILELDKKISEEESEIETLKEKIEVYRSQMFSVKTQKEFDALKSEIQSNQARIKVLEDEGLSNLSIKDEKDEQIKKIKSDYELKQDELKQLTKELDKYKNSVSEQKNECTAKKKELIKKLKTKTQKAYYRILERRGTPVLSPVISKNCSVCSIAIPPQKVNEIRKEEKIYFCDSCSRILFWEAEMQPEKE